MDSDFQLDKGKPPESLVCVPDARPPSDAGPSFMCKVEQNESLHINTSNRPFPNAIILFTTSAPLSWTQCNKLCRLLVIKDDLLIPMWGERGNALIPTVFVIMVSCYAISGEKIQPPTNSIFWCLEVLLGPPLLHTPNLTVQNKRFDMWRTSFLCQQCLELLCCTRLCTTHTWADRKSVV